MNTSVIVLGVFWVNVSIRYYIPPTEKRQRELRGHWFLKNRYLFFFKRKPIKLLDRYQRWRKIAKLLKLSPEAWKRLEGIIYYQTEAKRNVTKTCRYFGIARKTFYQWYHRFQGKNFWALENREKTPKNKRQREITSQQEQNIINLRKKYLGWSPQKLALIYLREYGEKVSAWKIQKVIEK